MARQIWANRCAENRAIPATALPTTDAAAAVPLATVGPKSSTCLRLTEAFRHRPRTLPRRGLPGSGAAASASAGALGCGSAASAHEFTLITFVSATTSCIIPRRAPDQPVARRLETNPLAEEPESPAVTIACTHRLHPLAVVHEGLVVVASLVDVASLPVVVVLRCGSAGLRVGLPAGLGRSALAVPSPTPSRPAKAIPPARIGAAVRRVSNMGDSIHSCVFTRHSTATRKGRYGRRLGHHCAEVRRPLCVR